MNERLAVSRIGGVALDRKVSDVERKLRLELAAAFRVALPDDRVGLLVVRSRTVDFLTTASVSAAMFYIAWTIDPLGTS